MKGLIITLGIMLAFIGAGIGASIYIYTGLERDLDDARNVGFEEGYSTGYNQGLKEGGQAGYQEGSLDSLVESGLEVEREVVSGAYFLYNPTYSEMYDIIHQSDVRTAKELHDFAEVNGIRAAYVRCPIAREAREGRIYLYQLVAFETVDRGLVIIEPKSHQEVKVEVGQSYSELNGLPPAEYDDTITKMTIVW